ncbi:hypothetical protein ACFFLM_05725 [Deinococcus oregonensis]|uniref:Uncharacterized protein n=1 Tax=Deinococcus oregonensis TaxID=1805970 RepID=A0ABV6AVD2_9DEIO
MSPAFHTSICRWVPGTLNRIRILTGSHEEIVDLQHIIRRFGREALHSLYLRGIYVHPHGH